MLKLFVKMRQEAIRRVSAPIMTVPPPQLLLSFGHRWHENIVTSVFWVGEPARPEIHDRGNLKSSFDTSWLVRSKYQSPFYVALPFTDLLPGPHTKPEAAAIIPWFRQAFVRDGQSVCNGRWIAIRHAGRVCYAQWRDSGPRVTDDVSYVFGNARPKSDRGLDVSPAVRDYLALHDLDVSDWTFITTPPSGPWWTSSDNYAQLKGSK
jgi:hypothetical protein